MCSNFRKALNHNRVAPKKAGGVGPGIDRRHALYLTDTSQRTKTAGAMKRSAEELVTSRGSGSDANVPWPKRMATSEPTSTTRFGYRPKPCVPTVGSGSVSADPAASNQTEGQDQAKLAGDEQPESVRNGGDEPTEATRAPTNTRSTFRERSLPRPNVRKAAAAPPRTDAVPAPRSTTRLALKQPVAAAGARRASDSVATQQLATALTRRASENPQHPWTEPKGVVVGKENSDPIGTNVLRSMLAFDSFLASRWTQETVATVEAMLQLRLKAKKFDMKNRVEEAQSHNRQLKGSLRSVVDDQKAVLQEWNQAKIQIETDIVGHDAKLKRLQALVTEKDLQLVRANQELEGANRVSALADKRVRDLTEQNKLLVEDQSRWKRVRAEMEASNQQLQTQLQLAQKQNDELTLELRAHQATMSDRVMLYEEKKKELEQFYQRKDSEEDKRKAIEIERLQARLSEVREEMAGVNQEKEMYRQRVITIEEEARRERDRCGQMERDKYSIEAQLRSVEDRLQQTNSDLAQMKTKLDQKDQEISGLVQSLTEIQRMNAMSSSKIDSEKRELVERLEHVQEKLREKDRSEATNDATIRELRAQVDVFAGAKSAWAEKQLELDVRIKDLELQLQHSSRDLSVEVGVRQMLEAQNRELRNENTATNAQTEAIRFEMRRIQASHEDSKAKWQSELASVHEKLEQEKSELRRQMERLHEERVSVESEAKTLRERVANARDGDFQELCDVKREAEVLRLRLQELSNQGYQSMAQKDKLIDELQEKVRVGEKTRRTLHNTIQELRGNVRVFARTRPFLPSDGVKDQDSVVPVVSCEFDGQTMKLKRQSKSGASGDQETYSFTFDKAFAPSCGQDSIFDEVSEFVQSSIDGYHVCLFSYGQTGSGKTHTMQGSGNGQMRGIIPRAIEKVLAECSMLKEHGWTYTMQVSFLEIYNETLKDLLASKEDMNKVLAIKKDAKGGVYVPDLTLVEVTQMSQVEKLMERASRARSVACTEMNAQSSRSHSVFTLHLQGVNDSEGIVLDGKLNLVDLAGSERASRSGVAGDRLKETQAINKSLSCLADVFTAIGNKSAHIPFRNSKLTYLLQSSLSGDGKTLMMVNVSPTCESAGETLCSLRFAQQVNKCELGKPKRQIKSKKDI